MGCLAACAQMALNQLGLSVTQRELNRLLGLTPLGIPYPHIQRLDRYGVNVVLQRGDEFSLRTAIDQGVAPIVFMMTIGLSYWTEETQHALVMVGYNDQNVFLNDPAFADAPKSVSWDGFMIGWVEFDCWYALITK
jgi:ABC-type bacteriocin/lantibiotic exporter with double-glycine peptidase domain